MEELLGRLLQIPFWTRFADLHGLLAMAALVLFGSGIVLYFLSSQTKAAGIWLKGVLLLLFLDLIFLDGAGLLVYMPYRAPGGPRTILNASSETAWLHTIIFEHKEFLAFAPPLLIFCALAIVWVLSDSFTEEKTFPWLRKAVLTSLVLSLLFVLIVATEAVLVTKVAPV